MSDYRRRWILLGLVLALCPGCEADDDPPFSNGGSSVEVLCDDGIDNDLDGPIDCEDSDCAEAPNCASGDDDDSAGDDDDAAAGPFATLHGLVTRSVPIQQDGVGTLIVDVLEGDPFENIKTLSTASVWLEEVDFSAEGTTVKYSLDVPVRDEPYYIAAVFDDDGDADPAAFLPSEGDLLSISEAGLVILTLQVEESVELNLDLQTVCCPF